MAFGGVNSFKTKVLLIAPRERINKSNIKGSYTWDVGMGTDCFHAAYGISRCPYFTIKFASGAAGVITQRERE